MDRLEILYRGSLRSCNYHCSYCPFSKHRRSEQELRKDREQWEYFVQTMGKRTKGLQMCTLMVVPYGEALIHPWYWEGLAYVSTLSEIQAAGAQTNLSFGAEESLKVFRQSGGHMEKLRLWGTFHPEMVSVDEFVKKCRQLRDAGVNLCAGAVGVPAHLRLLKELREKLPKEIYLWINRMDGLRRSYTPEEAEAFTKIDPYFQRELSILPADSGQCQNRLFVEGNGKLRICNISRTLDLEWEQYLAGSKNVCSTTCRQKSCSCYLAYGGRQNFMNEILFGPHPIFRIPRRAKAVFLDIMGTLFPKKNTGREHIPGWVRAGLEGLHRDGILLFFATTLPYEEARKRCREIWHLFSGGVFAGGAHMVLEEAGGRWELVRKLPEESLSVLETFGKHCQYRIRSYRVRGTLCKLTMLHPVSADDRDGTNWDVTEQEKLREMLERKGICKVRVLAEDRCLQLLPEEAVKAEGVRVLCRRLRISPSDTIAAGDSAEDEEMKMLCGGKGEQENSCFLHC